MECIETLLNCGNLEDLAEPINYDIKYKESNVKNNIYTVQNYDDLNYTVDNEFNPPLRSSINQNLLNEFNTQNKTLKEDWEEWMRKSSIELLKQSPNIVLSCCFHLAEIYPHIWQELYNLAFASCWEVFNDRQKEIIIKEIDNAIKNTNIPQSILQTLLSLAEFMQHDQEGIQIDSSILGDLAERCNSYSQALYFREQEFETPNEKTVESLIILYNHLGQPEAANGLIEYAKRNFQINLKSWNNNIQKLNDNNTELNHYNICNSIQNNNEDQNEFIVHQLRRLNDSSQYEDILEKTQQYFKMESKIDQEKKHQISLIASSAALNLNEWEQLNIYSKNIQDNQVEYYFYQAVLSIKNSQYDDALKAVKNSYNALEGNLGEGNLKMFLIESYSKRYDHIMRLQQLFEMEEIINFKKVELQEKEQQSKNQNDLKEKHNHNKSDRIDDRKQNLKDIWFDRLQGCQKKVHVWQGVLSIRELLFKKSETIDNWLKFSRIAIKKRQTELAKRYIIELKNEIGDKNKCPIELQMAGYECDYYMGQLNYSQIIEDVGQYLDSQDKTLQKNHKVISKGYLNLSKWLNEFQLEEIAEDQKKKIKEFQFKYILESTKIRQDNYKAYHSLAVINYQEIDFQQKKQNNQIQKQYIIEATKGFVKAISLQGKNMFQDTLRLLNIVFNYGDWDEVRDNFQAGWKNIDILVWIEVVPQIIARIDINNKKIYELLKNLLIRLNSDYPQALIYQLVVTKRSKKEKSSQAAQDLLEEMKKKDEKLVNLAETICQELIRAAILLSELWKDGFYDAWQAYSTSNNPSKALLILKELNDKTNIKEPQSLSETAFLQQYGPEIRTAYAWLELYEQNKDEVALNHALNIYYHLYQKVQVKIENLNMIHLENVSPKLLSIQNTILALPGLYNPNKPIITIARFCPKLSIQNSKQKPRRIMIYGSDEKEYHYLLKGHEDLRQDERVMQLFSLINRLLNNNQESEEKEIFLQRYAVIPLSNDAGLIEWVHNCDTLQTLIKDYREGQNIKPQIESNLIGQMIPQANNNYKLLPVFNKLELFRYVMENTKGEDLQKVMWLKSPNSAVWLERRTNYTRSLATMSMVGYILGLGDRHPSNIMLQRNTGRIVHIDFGDCWEVAMKRSQCPEKVPFRLTRMLIKAMEACRIEGNFRSTCELVMKVLRDNRESLMAVLEAFLYDPLLNWRLLEKNQTQTNNEEQEKNETQFGSLIKLKLENQITQNKDFKKNQSSKRDEILIERDIIREYDDNNSNIDNVQINERALQVINRCKNKLIGKDFQENKALSVLEQVNKLINQATSHENICQSYIGWQPFW